MADERTDDRIAPVALPAGSFELRELQAALEKATSGKDREKHPELINQAIAETIHMPEILANADAPGVPNGADLVEQPIVYVEGEEPVMRKVPAFRPAVDPSDPDAEDVKEPWKYKYDERGGVPAVVGAPAAVVVDEEAPLTLGEAAAVVVDEGDTKPGGKGK